MEKDEQSDDLIDRAYFMSELEKAKEKLSIFKLSVALGVRERRMMYWRQGKGPTQKTMKEKLPILEQIQNETK